MAKTNSTQRPKARKGAERACLRCGCTEQRACSGGCSWVNHSDVCDACLSPAEEDLLAELCNAFGSAKTEIDAERVHNRLATFGRYLNETSADMPIPYRPLTPLKIKIGKGGGK